VIGTRSRQLILTDKVIIGFLIAWMLAIAYFWIAPPSAKRGFVQCHYLPILQTIGGHGVDPVDANAPENSVACAHLEDRASVRGFLVFGGGIVLLLAGILVFAAGTKPRGKPT
jgi:hypothetical protein